MSRTNKDKKWKFRDVENDWNFGVWDFYPFLKKPYVKRKKKKSVDCEWHWMSTPSEWTRLMMNRPMRREARVWERKVLFQDIEEADLPNTGHKPHIYYW